MNTLTCPYCQYQTDAPAPDGGEFFCCTHCLKLLPNPLLHRGGKAFVSGGRVYAPDSEGDLVYYDLMEVRRASPAKEDARLNDVPEGGGK